jgi:hypothetical protein
MHGCNTQGLNSAESAQKGVQNYRARLILILS